MVKAHICIANNATSRWCERGRRTATASGPLAQAATVTGAGMWSRRRSSGTATAAATAPAAPARTAVLSAGDGRERLRIGSASIGLPAVSGHGGAPLLLIRMAAL